MSAAGPPQGANYSPSGGSETAKPQAWGSSLTAEQKFACPACGGESVWNPAKQKMVCPFCGTESPITLTVTGAIVEHDLVSALRGIADAQRGWKSEKREVR